MRRGWAWGLWIVAGLIALYSGGIGAAESLEYPVKAAYLSKFGQFVTWPEGAFSSPTSPVGICIMGTDPFGPDLDRIARTQTVGHRPIEVRRLDWSDKVEDCHILYLSADRNAPVENTLRRLRGEPVLTVTDVDSMEDTRGIIHFAINSNRVRFHIDNRIAALNGLSISSKLLGLALSVTSQS